jgi:NAD-dependent dihydropyrimidine dehydrogenase PreA subunit
MRRKIITIDESKCDGCGECVPACKEGALQVIEGKARLVSEVYCDGLGACLGECPKDAIRVEEREAEAFDEAEVERHLGHAAGRPAPLLQLPIAMTPRSPHGEVGHGHGGACPGSAHRMLRPAAAPTAASATGPAAASTESALSHWPVQLALVSPMAPFLKGADILVCADCVPFAIPDFHARYLTGRVVLVGCPKLDDLDSYRERLAQILARAQPRSLTVLRMEVPCCGGIAQAALEARGERPIPTEVHIIGVGGAVLEVQRPRNAVAQGSLK